jgi:threonine dehydrogenase-like Zn-dependent dehydrogenase
MRLPSVALSWSLEAVAKAGTISIIGVYGEVDSYPIGKAMEKNLTLTMGNCNHRRYIPHLVELVRNGTFNPAEILTREPGWVKVKLEPPSGQQAAA